jgi:hypothetical protein
VLPRVAMVLLLLFTVVQPSLATEPVTARIEGRVLTLHFPPNTLHRTVSFQFDGCDVPRYLSLGKNPAIRWIDDQNMTVELHRVKRAISSRWVNRARIWGQTRDGSALLQTVDLPGKRDATDPHARSSGSRATP